MKYILQEVKKAIDGTEPIGSGMEGKVYRAEFDKDCAWEPGHAVKVRDYVWKGRNVGQAIDNRGEFFRHAMHSAVNAASNGKVKWNGNKSAYLVDILQCYIDGNRSISLMPHERGARMISMRPDANGMFQEFQKYGVCVDLNEDNVLERVCYTGCGGPPDLEFAVLEVVGGLHPEMLKTLGTKDPKTRRDAMEHVARAHLFGVTMDCPTSTQGMIAPFESAFANRWYDMKWPEIMMISEATGHKRVTKDNKEDIFREYLRIMNIDSFGYSSMFEEWCTTGFSAILEARSFFGEQFVPVPFDWEDGTTLENYGIDPETFHEFRMEIDRQRPYVDSVNELSRIEMEKTKPERGD